MPSPRPRRRGATLAPGYTVVAHLARGEALDVYDAWDADRHCRCVVKTIRPDRAHETRVRNRLTREGRLLKRLAHPHLVRGYDVLEDAIVLETVPGATLETALDDLDGPFPARQVALLGAQLASALAYLHGHGQLHLDVKPSNVVVGGGSVKLLDLSLARPPGRVKRGYGTPDYMAPEQARGGAVDAAADVWGLGAVLHEAASGVVPGDEPRAPLGTLRRVPKALSGLVDDCLREGPADRPQLSEALAALDALAG